jgi:AcrR family transcriptional regulator
MPARTDKPPLSRERVVSTAVAIADDEGVAALTMRRLADALDCEAMSLYYYVDGKKALLEAVVEAVVGEIAEATLQLPAAGDDGDWRDVVEARCHGAREVMLRHPWAPALVAAQAEAPPTAMPSFEALVATMVEAGLGYDLAHRAIHSLGSMLLGFTQELFEPSADDAGASSEETAAMAASMPHLARLAEIAVHEAEGSLSVCDTRAEFEFTLRLILDGLEAHRPA